MKILFIHTYYQQRGGEDSVFESEVRIMKKLGYQIDTLTFSNSENTFFKWLFSLYNPSSYFNTVKKIKDFRPDVVHIHNLHFAGAQGILAAIRKLDIPVYMTVHNFRFLCPSGSLFFNNGVYLESLGKKFPWDAIRKGVYRKSKLSTFWLAFNSYVLKKSLGWKHVTGFILLNEWANKIFQISQPDMLGRILVKPNFFPDPGLTQTSRKNNFLFVGRLNDEKGISLLLKAHTILRFHLTIIGDGPIKKIVERHCEQFSDAVFLGYQPGEVVIQNLRSCAAFLMPSVCMEMNPFTLLEGLSCGTPVIASDIQTLQPYIAESHALIFKTGDVDDLIKSIIHFVALTSEEKNNLSIRARATYAKYFTEERHLAVMQNLYSIATNG